jgi:hypothetical protein
MTRIRLALFGILADALAFAATIVGPSSPAVATERVNFELGSVVRFSEPLMSCPDLNDALAANKQNAEWLASHGCKNLDPSVEEWLAVHGGSGRTRSGVNVYTYGCMISKARWDQTKAEFQRRTTYPQLRLYFIPWQEQLRKECRYVVRR